MKPNNNRNILLIFPVILYFVFLAPSIGLNHISLAHSQNQGSSFQAEVKALDDMPSKKV